jgi:uncharacterized protein (DUF1778 family)
MAATLTTTIRLAPAAKRRLAAAAKRRGISTHKFIVEAALDRADGVTDDAKLRRLEAAISKLHEVVVDELDYRTADADRQKHLKSGSKLLTGDEVRRGLGLKKLSRPVGDSRTVAEVVGFLRKGIKEAEAGQDVELDTALD